MNSDKLLQVLDLVHEVFPLPQTEELKGTHHFIKDRETGKLKLVIWYWRFSQVKAWWIMFDPGDEITREMLEAHGPTL